MPVRWRFLHHILKVRFQQQLRQCYGQQGVPGIQLLPVSLLFQEYLCLRQLPGQRHLQDNESDRLQGSVYTGHVLSGLLYFHQEYLWQSALLQHQEVPLLQKYQ